MKKKVKSKVKEHNFCIRCGWCGKDWEKSYHRFWHELWLKATKGVGGQAIHFH